MTDVKTKKNAYSIDEFECEFANSDYAHELTPEQFEYFNTTPLEQIVADIKQPNCEEWKNDIFYEYCDFFACSIALEEGEEDIPDRQTFANAIHDLIIANF